jgi:hypothetical protein
MSHLHLLDSLTLDVFICTFVKRELFGWIAHDMFYFSVSKKCHLSIQIVSRSFQNIEYNCNNSKKKWKEFKSVQIGLIYE